MFSAEQPALSQVILEQEQTVNQRVGLKEIFSTAYAIMKARNSR